LLQTNTGKTRLAEKRQSLLSWKAFGA